MQVWEARPQVGIGPLRLGMTHAEVAQALQEVFGAEVPAYHAFGVGEVEGLTMDYFPDLGLLVRFDHAHQAYAICCWGAASTAAVVPTLDGTPLLGLPMREARTLVAALAPEADNGSTGVGTARFGFHLSKRRDHGYREEKTIARVVVFRQGGPIHDLAAWRLAPLPDRLGSEDLTRLGADPFTPLRAAVAEHLNAPPEALERFMLDDHMPVVFAAERHPRATVAIRLFDALHQGLASGRLRQVFALHLRTGLSFTRCLYRRHWPDTSAFDPWLLATLERIYHVPGAYLHDREIAPETLATLPEARIRRHRVLPLKRRGARVILAMVDPGDITAHAAVAPYLEGLEQRIVVVTEAAFDAFVLRVYLGGVPTPGELVMKDLLLRQEAQRQTSTQVRVRRPRRA